MTQLLPGTEVRAPGLRWEVVLSEPLGPQTLFRLRGLEGAVKGQEIDLLHPFERLEPVIHELQRLTKENRRLRAEIEDLRARLGEGTLSATLSEDSAPDPKHREVPSPIVVAPQGAIPLADIIRYDPDNHKHLHRMGYEDAKAAWARAGRRVEGGVG